MKEVNSPKEDMKTTNSLPFTIIRPGGNDTALVQGLIIDATERKKINDEIMNLFPNVEQVGFIELSPQSIELKMAGGEFCGNAMRSTAWLALKREPGEIDMNVSGVERTLKAGVDQNGAAFAEMPIYTDPEKIQQVGDDQYIVIMEGITQFVEFTTDELNETLSDEQIKQRAWRILKNRDLDQYSAAGVMTVVKKDERYSLTPVVYVRDIDTLFLETACGSGTTAVGMVIAKNQGTSVEKLAITQPSGMDIEVSVYMNGDVFTYADIRGNIAELTQGSLEPCINGKYVVERVSSDNRLTELLNQGLGELYSEIFSKPPYYEQFTEQEILDIFKEYTEQGILFAARYTDQIVGFGAAVPLNTQGELSSLASQFGIDSQNTWYMADLGVSESMRKQGVARTLVDKRLQHIPKGSLVIMRTSIANIASQSLYRSLEFQLVPGMKQDVLQERIDGEIQKDERIFMIKQI